ncbi:hypothetical protein [Mesorhizobium sp.]|uniref:hypothetical protein n=1 Tax=Mesorhizobium sp. TaxID=1871066 RepID=UPI002600A1AC|nr:hypothetical protein [Mesorhizobium sp.]
MEAGQIATGEGGQIWAIPHAFENIQLFYRKDTLEKYNIAVPTSPPEMAGRTPMAIDSNMFGFWNDVAGKPASGEDRLRSAAARTERHELRFQHLDLSSRHERGFRKEGRGLAVHPVGHLQAGGAQGVVVRPD